MRIQNKFLALLFTSFLTVSSAQAGDSVLKFDCVQNTFPTTSTRGTVHVSGEITLNTLKKVAAGKLTVEAQVDQELSQIAQLDINQTIDARGSLVSNQDGSKKIALTGVGLLDQKTASQLQSLDLALKAGAKSSMVISIAGFVHVSFNQLNCSFEK